MSQVVRLLVVIIPAFVLTGAVVAVGYEYGRAWRADLKIARATGAPLMSAGILPRHVFLISVSYLMAILFVASTSVSNWNKPVTGFTFIAGLMLYTGLAAMLGMIKFERKRHEDVSP